MSTDYKDLEFSKAEKGILKSFSNNRRIPLSIKGNPKYAFLFKYYLLDYSDHSHQFYCLSDKARFYLRYNRKDHFRFWFPVVLSILAIIISIVALVATLL